MRHIKIIVEDKEYPKIIKLKGEMSWDKFFMSLIKKEGSKNGSAKN